MVATSSHHSSMLLRQTSPTKLLSANRDSNSSTGTAVHAHQPEVRTGLSEPDGLQQNLRLVSKEAKLDQLLITGEIHHTTVDRTHYRFDGLCVRCLFDFDLFCELCVW